MQAEQNNLLRHHLQSDLHHSAKSSTDTMTSAVYDNLPPGKPLETGYKIGVRRPTAVQGHRRFNGSDSQGEWSTFYWGIHPGIVLLS